MSVRKTDRWFDFANKFWIWSSPSCCSGESSYVHIFSTNTFTYLWNWNWDSWISWCPFSNVWFFNFAFDEGANTWIGCRAATGATFHFWLGSNWRWGALNLMQGNNSRLPPLGLWPMRQGTHGVASQHYSVSFCRGFAIIFFCTGRPSDTICHATFSRWKLDSDGTAWNLMEVQSTERIPAGNFCHVSFQLAR